MSSKPLPVVWLLLSTVCAAQPPALKLYDAVEPHMGTLVRIKLYAADQHAAKAGFQAAFARIAELDNELSDYKPDSELNIATRAAALQPVHIGDDLATVLKASQRLAVETDGAFDITIGPLTKLWRTARKEGRLPTQEAISAARARCGYRKLHLDPATQTMKLDMPDMQLDLGAIAKGYAADEALLVLSKMGLKTSLVAASGDLAFGDAPPDQPGWKIGIDSLDQSDKPFTRVLLLHNAAVSTAGSSEQYLETNHQKYSHIIDPKTGMGLTTDITVTAVSRHGITADGADTAITLLGAENGLAFAERHPELAAFILENNHSFESSRFRTLVQEQHAAY